jgi:hypothetical protein
MIGSPHYPNFRADFIAADASDTGFGFVLLDSTHREILKWRMTGALLSDGGTSSSRIVRLQRTLL